MTFKSLGPENQYCVKCPIFEVETRLSQCFMLRTKLWRGDRIEQRQGCQVALNWGKCPINHMIDDMFKTGEDKYFSPVAKVGPIEPDTLRRIAPVRITDWMMRNHHLSDKVREMFMKANTQTAETFGGAPQLPARPAKAAKTSTKTTKPKPTPASALEKAATTGDMSAAITAAVAEASV